VFKFTDDLHLTWGDVPHKPRPSDPPMPAKPYRSAVIVAVVCFLLGCGAVAAAYGIGAHRSDERAAEAATEATEAEAANGIKVAALAEAKMWREAAEESSETAAALRSEVASLTAELELWESRYQDSVKRIDALEAAAKLKLQSTPAKKPTPIQASGSWRRAVASWYGPGFYGRTMAGGGKLTTTSVIVAHRTLAFGTRVEFRYEGHTVVAEVRDRGPFVAGREWDLGPGTAKALNHFFTGPVEYRILGG
jgi:rare lipoprotein A (peptidoglycan hydrolase)